MLYNVCMKVVESMVPKHTQVYTAILEDIKSGNYKGGDLIPSEKILCEKYGVSRITIRKAVSDLQNYGYLVKKPGKGTFVTYIKIIEKPNISSSFSKSCRELGLVPKTIVISKKKNYRKEIEKDKKIKIERLRFVNDIPSIYEIDYFSENFDFILESDIENQPIMDVIRKKTGLVAYEFIDSFEIKISDEKLSKYLIVNEGSPLLKIKQEVLTEEGELIYYNEQYIVSEIYQYVVRHGR